MKYILLFTTTIVLAASCRKTYCPLPPNRLANTEWVNVDDANMNLAFTSDVVILSYPSFTPPNEATPYTQLGGDTIYIPSVPVKWVLSVKSDTLHFTNVKNNVKMKFIRHY